LVSQYATHSGRASQDIGVLRLLGYRVPERYHYPFLAKSPQEFWQRWNTYVGDWAKTYLFLPMALGFRKNGVRPAQSAVTSALLTFLLVGLMHQITVVWEPSMKPWGFTLWFALNGVLVVVWRATPPLAVSRRVSRPVRSLVFLAAVFVMSWAALRLI
jgi:D-alanyl-lipoteichoic acid acyltransferase DltB (MBOAT superfamily)